MCDHRLLVHFRAVLLACLVAACSAETVPTDPIPLEPTPATSGTLELTVRETGALPDTDGYELAIRFATERDPVVRTIGPGGATLQLSDLPLGVHTIQLAGLAPNCRVIGRHPRAFAILPGKATSVSVSVFCPGPGAILVSTLTRGPDVDVAGYRLAIAGESTAERSIGLNDSLTIPEQDLPAGTIWFVTLTGVPGNCWVDEPPATVRELDGATVRLDYAVACIPRSSMLAFQFLSDIYVADGPEARNLTALQSGPARGPSLSPDRSRVVYSGVSETPGRFDLHLVGADGLGERWLTSDGSGSFVGTQAWSPDGSRIVFWKQHDQGSDIQVMSANGGEAVSLTHGGWNDSPAWSPDGSTIAFCHLEGDPFDGFYGLYRMSAIDGSAVTRLADAGGRCDPAWSPDGSRIAFTHFEDFVFGQNLAVIGADGSGLTTLPPETVNSRQESPSWSPDGSWIAYAGGVSSNRLWIVGFGAAGFGEPFAYRFGASPSWR